MKKLLFGLAVAGLALFSSPAFAQQNVPISGLPTLQTPDDVDLFVVEHLAAQNGQKTNAIVASDLAAYFATKFPAGPQGPAGAAGATGPTGPANSLSIGTVSSSTTAAATITGTAPTQTLNLTYPLDQFTIGTVTTGSPGSSAAASISGTPPNQTLNLTLPQGTQGPQGTAGTGNGNVNSTGGTYVAGQIVTYADTTGNSITPSTPSTLRTYLGLGSIATQAASAVAITGGAIDGTPIGGTTRAAGAFTTLSATTAIPVSSGGTNATSASGTALDNISGFASTGFIQRTGAGAYSFTSATNGITPAMMQQAPALTLRGNITGSTANVADSTPTAVLDAAFGSTSGQMLVRGASTWGVTTAAVAADVRTGSDTTKPVTAAALSGSQAFQTLTDATTVAWNGQSGFNATVTLGGNRTLGAISNPVLGQTYTLLIFQDGTGSRTLAYNAAYDFGTAGTPTLTTTASKHDLLTVICTNAVTPTFDAVLNKGF